MISLKPLDINNAEQIEAYTKWENDLDFYHLIAPMKKGEKIEQYTIESTINHFQILESGSLFCFDDVDCQHFLVQKGKSSWFNEN